MNVQKSASARLWNELKEEFQVEALQAASELYDGIVFTLNFTKASAFMMNRGIGGLENVFKDCVIQYSNGSIHETNDITIMWGPSKYLVKNVDMRNGPEGGRSAVKGP